MTDAPSRKPVVLMVDDSPFDLKLASAVMTREGVDVVTASTWPEVNPLLFARRFDLIVCDIQMPGLSGDRLVEILRSVPPARELPIVLCSHLPEEEIRARAERCGADAWLQKPMTSSKAKGLLKNWLKLG